MIARMLELNDVQEGVLSVVFGAVDDERLLLLDLKDLQAALTYAAENAAALGARYGNASTATVATIQRKLLVLEDQGGARLFGEAALDLSDFMRKDASGRGFVNILAADGLIASPRLYATFLLWLMSELFEVLQSGAAAKARLEHGGSGEVAPPRAPRTTPGSARPPSPGRGRQTLTETFAKQLLRTLASSAGREIMRGVLGGMRRR